MENTQQKQLIQLFQNGGTITSLESFNQLGITQLATRILELEEQGYKISRERKEVTNRFGKKVRVVEYSMEHQNG